jgi:hypothetical protein
METEMTDSGTADRLQAARQRLRVKLAVRVDANRLLVDASLNNGTGQVVHVFNVLWDYAPSGAIAAPDSPAYVCIDGQELRLACRPLPNPPGRKMIVAIDPFLTPLDAGADMRQELSFDVPVQEYSCYFRREASSPVQVVESARARFIFGVAVGASDGAFAPSPIQGALQLANPTKLAGIVIVESDPVACKVQVAQRKDAFTRF